MEQRRARDDGFVFIASQDEMRAIESILAEYMDNHQEDEAWNRVPPDLAEKFIGGLDDDGNFFYPPDVDLYDDDMISLLEILLQTDLDDFDKVELLNRWFECFWMYGTHIIEVLIAAWRAHLRTKRSNKETEDHFSFDEFLAEEQFREIIDRVQNFFESPQAHLTHIRKTTDHKWSANWYDKKIGVQFTITKEPFDLDQIGEVIYP